MLDNEIDFLSCPDRPAIYTAQQTAWRLNIPLKAIPNLMRDGFLHPMGRPAQNGHKYFHKHEVEALGNNWKSMSAVLECVQEYWRQKNARKTKKNPQKEQPPEDWSV